MSSSRFVSDRIRQCLLERLAPACPGPELADVLWTAEVLARRCRVRRGQSRTLDRIAAQALLETLTVLAARRSREREADLRPTPSALLAAVDIM